MKIRSVGKKDGSSYSIKSDSRPILSWECVYGVFKLFLVLIACLLVSESILISRRKPTGKLTAVGNQGYVFCLVSFKRRKPTGKLIAVGNQGYVFCWVSFKRRKPTGKLTAVGNQGYVFCWVSLKTRKPTGKLIAVGNQGYVFCLVSCKRRKRSGFDAAAGDMRIIWVTGRRNSSCLILKIN